MPYQIDIFSTPANMGAEFTVNTAVTSVDLTQTVPGVPQTMTAGQGTIAGGGYWLAEGDNFIILSAGYMMPESFVMSSYDIAALGEFTLPIMFLRGSVDGGGPILSIDQFGNNGQLRIPFENYELSIGTFVDPVKRGLVGARFRLQCLFPLTVGLDNPRVSMLNVPAAINGVTYQVSPFIKVLHNNQLT